MDDEITAEATLRLARRMLGRRRLLPADRDDLVQEVALAVCRRRSSYCRERGSAATWIAGIVSIELRAWARRRSRIPGDIVAELPEPVVESDVEAALHARELLAAVPPAERRVLELHASGLTMREIAAAERIAPSTACVRRARGLRVLREGAGGARGAA